MWSLVLAVVMSQADCSSEVWCGYDVPECAKAARELEKKPSVARAEEVLRSESGFTTRIVAMRILAKAKKQSLEVHAFKLANETHDCRFEGIELLGSVPKWSDETRAFIERGFGTNWPQPYLRAISEREEPWARAYLLQTLRSKEKDTTLRSFRSPPTHPEVKAEVTRIANVTCRCRAVSSRRRR
ncbi:MAG: hypothetical protein ACO1OB_20900 [Archangium sp.]